MTAEKRKRAILHITEEGNTMNIFDEEVAEKKKIASGAKHKRGGDGKTCHLATDDMSPKQLNSMNGEVKVYQLGKPMDWATFLDMPPDLQKMYVELLIKKYNVTNTRMAVMFGISNGTLSYRLTRLGIFRKRGRADTTMTPAEMEGWERFLAQKTK